MIGETQRRRKTKIKNRVKIILHRQNLKVVYKLKLVYEQNYTYSQIIRVGKGRNFNVLA